MSYKFISSPPDNLDGDEALIHLLVGIIVEVNTERNVAKVNSPHGLFSNVRIPYPHYSSSGSGIFMTPNIGDTVTFGITSTREAFILNFYAFNPEQEKTAGDRVVPAPHTYVIHTKAGDTIQVSTDYQTAGIALTSPKSIDLGVINGKLTSKGTDTNGTETSRIELDTAPGISTFTVKDGDGSALVTQKQLQDVIDRILSIIDSLTLPVSGSIAGPPIPPRTVVTAGGVTGLQTMKASQAGPIASSESVPADVATDPTVASAAAVADNTSSVVTAAQNTLDTARSAVEAGKPAVQAAATAYTAAMPLYQTAETAYSAAGGNPKLLTDMSVTEAAAELAFRATPIGMAAFAVYGPIQAAFAVVKTAYTTAQTTYSGLMTTLDTAQQNVNTAVAQALAAKQTLDTAITAAQTMAATSILIV